MRDQAVRVAVGDSEKEAARIAKTSRQTISRYELDPMFIASRRLRARCTKYYRDLRAILRLRVELGHLSIPIGELGERAGGA